MMGLFIISKLLLVTLLLQPTEEELKTHSPTEPDSSTPYGEFCLRLADGPHWTTSESPDQPRSTRPTKHATQQSKQPTAAHVDSQLAQPITEPTPTSTPPHELTVEEGNPDTLLMDSMNIQGQAIGCKCRDKEKKPLDDISRFIVNVVTEFPSDKCNSYEYFVILKDNSTVCVFKSSLLKFYDDMQQRPHTATERKGYEGAVVTSPAPIGPTTKKDFSNNGPGARFCGSCSFTTDLDNVNPKTVQSLTVRHPFRCPLHIYISLNDNKKNCLDSNQPNLEEMLIKLDSLLSQTPKNIIDGCRCTEMGRKAPGETSPVRSTTIWPGGERCSHSEFIETLMDGREVCVTALSLSEYLGLPRLEERGSRDDGFVGVSVEREKDQNDRTEENWVDAHENLHIDNHMKLPMFKEDARPVCNACISFESWELVDPQDVQSLRMEIQPDCPVLIHVRLKNDVDFCVQSSQPSFRALLERLDV